MGSFADITRCYAGRTSNCNEPLPASANLPHGSTPATVLGMQRLFLRLQQYRVVLAINAILE
jgi:hypothetical protein